MSKVYRRAQMHRGPEAEAVDLYDGEIFLAKDTGKVFIQNDAQLIRLDEQYVPSNPGYFANPQPTTAGEALDRLAAAVSGLLGTPIP